MCNLPNIVKLVDVLNINLNYKGVAGMTTRRGITACLLVHAFCVNKPVSLEKKCEWVSRVFMESMRTRVRWASAWHTPSASTESSSAASNFTMVGFPQRHKHDTQRRTKGWCGGGGGGGKGR